MKEPRIHGFGAPALLGPAARCLVAALALVATGSAASAGDQPPPADLIVVASTIHTADPEMPRAGALAAREGRLVAVGDSRDVLQLRGPDTEVVEAPDADVVPGFIDGHLHLASGASAVSGVYLYGISEKSEWLRLVARRAAELEPGAWITGGRWDHTLLPGQEFPTRHDLDAAAPDRPVALSDVDGHTLWANSRAIEIAGVDRSTADPVGGHIVREPDGDPSGIFLETAGRLITRHIPPPTTEERRDQLRQALAFANRHGVTGAHDMAGATVLEHYAALRDSGELTMRIWFGATGVGPEELEAWQRRRDGLGTGRSPATGPLLQVGYLKYVVDGVLSAHTAALLEPYADRPEVAGLPRYEQEELNGMVTRANAAGFPVAIHSIGDRGVRMSLDAFEHALEAVGPPPLPNRVEHVEAVDPADLPRFAELGVLASMQPHHCITGIDVYNTLRLGVERARYAFAWERLRQAGATLVFGTDWPTAPVDPLRQLYAAVLREKPGGGPPGGWTPHSRVDFEVALAAYTREAARAAGWGDEVGTITAGKWADFVVLSGLVPDPFDRSILELEVATTYLAGRPVHTSDDGE